MRRRKPTQNASWPQRASRPRIAHALGARAARKCLGEPVSPGKKNLLARIVGSSLTAGPPSRWQVGVARKAEVMRFGGPIARATERSDKRHASTRASGDLRIRKLLSPLLWSILAHGLFVIVLNQIGVFEGEPTAKLITLRPHMDSPSLEELEPIAALTTPLETLESQPSPEMTALSQPEIGSITGTMADELQGDVVAVSEPAALAGVADLLQRGAGQLLEPMRRRPAGPTTFFGLQSQGRAVCFLVDSSRSMRGKFDLARGEVVRAVAALNANQRFYVLLFDQNVERMKLGDLAPSQPVKATPENKRLLVQWLASVEMESSCDPEAALDAALGLDADVLFLLTDGELPASLLSMLRTRNRRAVDGRPQLKMAINTIGLHSFRGRELLMRLAMENGGAYRFVPKPRK